MIILTIITVGIVSICFIYNYFQSKRPQNNCNHNLTTTKTRVGQYSTEYLSTCNKCGYQKEHFFKGTNP